MVGQNRQLKWSLDDLDLTKPIEPLSRLINEPEKLIDEVFKIAAQYLPKDIVPASLKDIPTVELKKLCLEQLKKVEHQTLLNILSNDSNDSTDFPQTSQSDVKYDEKVADDQVKTKEAKDVEIQVEMNRTSTENEIGHCSKADEKSIKSESEGIPSASTSNEPANLDSILDQAEMEIRELELRAQAIRELLKKHEEADNALKANENQKESRKRLKIDPSLSREAKETENIEANKIDKIDSARSIHRKESRKSKESKATSRLTRNPVSMVEEDETGEDREESSADLGPDELVPKVKRRSLNESSNENNITMQVNTDSDDSIDRELKGE